MIQALKSVLFIVKVKTMFNKLLLPSDSQLSPEQLANSLMNQAIEQLMLLSGLSQAECEKLILTQLSPSQKPASMPFKTIISKHESEYISTLFA